MALSLRAREIQAAGPHYRAEPASAPAVNRLIVRGLAWRCGPGACLAGPSTSRPLTDCSALVREIGALRSFSAAGRQIDATDLEKCNARAR